MRSLSIKLISAGVFDIEVVCFGKQIGCVVLQVIFGSKVIKIGVGWCGVSCCVVWCVVWCGAWCGGWPGQLVCFLRVRFILSAARLFVCAGGMLGVLLCVGAVFVVWSVACRGRWCDADLLVLCVGAVLA